MHHIWKKFAGAGAAAAAALALSLLAAPVSADTTAEIVIAPPVATATTQPDDTQHSGWETVDGKRYYYDPETGEMQTGWLVLTNGSISRRYFFGEDGAVMTGFFRTDTNTSPVYYADEEGAVVKGGIHTIDGKPYWFYEDGSLHTGWQTVNGKRYFYDPVTGEITFGYCTEFIVAREKKRNPELLRSFLESLGDSLVLVEDDDIIKVHVHTDAPGRALTEALRYGPLQTVKIENMRNQHTSLADKETAAAPAAPAQPEAEAEPEIAPAEKEVGFVAVCAGDGMADLFRSLGADRIVTGGQTMNPSTDDILREVNKTPASTVFVFPNNKNIIMAAEQCIPLTEKTVRVIPTRTVPQGVAALAYMDPDQSPDDLEESFKESAARVHTALVTYAARDSDYDGHIIHAGEYLALLDGKLLGSYASLPTLLKELNWAFGELEPEFLTVYYGQDVTETDANGVAESLTSCFPEADVSLVSGGQPVYYYMIAAE